MSQPSSPKPSGTTPTKTATTTPTTTPTTTRPRAKSFTKDERFFLKNFKFDFDKCLMTTHGPNLDVLNMFKSYLQKDNSGRSIPLLSLYLQIKQNPSYYENSLYFEKKMEIEHHLKQDVFPRFIRTEEFRQFIVHKIRSLKKHSLLSQATTHSSTTTSPNTEPNHNTPTTATNSLLTASSTLTDDSTIQSVVAIHDRLVENNSHQEGTSVLSSSPNYSEPSSSSSPSLETTIVASTNNEASSSPITQQKEVDDANLTAFNQEVVDSNDNEEEDSEDTLSSCTTSSSTNSSGHKRDCKPAGVTPEELEMFNQAMRRRKHKHTQSTNDGSTSIFNNKAVMEYLETRFGSVALRLDICLFRTLAELKSSLFFSFDHLYGLELLDMDAPDWEVIYTIPATQDIVSQFKGISSSIHKDFLAKGGGSFTFQMCTGREQLYHRVMPDLSLDKTYKWKYHTFVPYSHHDAAALFTSLRDEKKYPVSPGLDIWEPTAISDDEFSNRGGRDFYCYDEKISIPTSTNNSFFKFNSSSRGLNMVMTNFYDSKRNQYVQLMKSLGYESTDLHDNTWGMKMMTVTKINNNLSKVSI